MSSRTISFFIKLFHLFSRFVPRSLHTIFTFVGNTVVFLLLTQYREAVKANLRIIGGGSYSEKEISRFAKRCFQNYALKLLDYMAMDRLNHENRKRWVEKEIGEGHLKNALKRGKGVICVTPHLGNWELGGYVLASKGYPINILTLKEESWYLSRYEERLRRKAGIRTIVIDPKEKPNLSILEMVGRLRSNEIIAVVMDRNYENQGMEVDFFGQSTPFPEGPVLLALETGASIIPVFVLMKRGMKYWGVIEEPVLIRRELDKKEAVREGLQEIAKRFEEKIRRHPDQWFNFFPFWKRGIRY